MQQFVIGRLKSDVDIGTKLELVTVFHLSHKICCEIIVKIVVNVVLLLFLLNQNSCNSQVRVVNTFIKVVKID